MMTKDIDCNNLLDRVERLEKQNSLFRRLGIAGFVLLMSGVIMGQSHPKADLVATGRLALKDVDGNDRITLLVDEHDRGTMRFQDKNGTVRALLRVDPKADCTLQLNGVEGKNRVSLIAVKDFGNSVLSLCGRDGNQKVMLGVVVRDLPMLTMVDDEGVRRLSVAVTPDGQVLVQTLDANGKILWQAPKQKE